MSTSQLLADLPRPQDLRHHVPVPRDVMQDLDDDEHKWEEGNEQDDSPHTSENSRLIEKDDDGLDEFGAILPASSTAAPYPKSVFYILTTEICERFSFYGLRTILILYLKYQLLYSENASTVLFHGFTMLCYFTPILGALIADLRLGRYKTILWMSCVYLAGNTIISISAATPLFPAVNTKNTVAILGLLLVAVGTGGIKPCVAAFGGDQFQLPQQEKMLNQFFSIFYFCINFGSLFSTLITPLIRENIKCFGGDCYLAAFGLPALLMAVSLAVYVAGSSTYRKVPATGTILTSTVACLWLGAVGKARSVMGRATRMTHWLDHARAEYEDDLVEDVRVLTSIMWLYLPLPIFWALFDQQGSRWTFQAARMDGTVGSIKVQPDQVQVLNPIMILLLVPVMERWIYPLLDSLGVLTTALQRMTVGGVMAALAFAAAAIVEWKIEDSVVTSGPLLSIAWLLPQYVLITVAEVLFSISGLQFSFNEAPASMKSVVQACWLLTISVGNLLVVLVADAGQLKSQIHEFIMFSGLMLGDIFIFAIMAHLYKPYKPVKVPDTPGGNSPVILMTSSTSRPSLDDDPTLYSYDDLKHKYEPTLDDDEENNVYDSADYANLSESDSKKDSETKGNANQTYDDKS